MITFTFNGLSFASDLRVNEVKGRGLTPTDISMISVPGMVGVHTRRKSRLPRTIEVKFTVVGTTLTDLRNKINRLSERLDLDAVAPLVFSDEPDKTYYAILASSSDDDEIKTYGFGTLVFLCPDPYKYGPEKVATLNGDTGTIVNVAGTAPTPPIIELDASVSSTFALVSNADNEYNMLGAAYDVDKTRFQKYTVALGHGMDNVTGWTPATVSDVDHPIGGAVNSVSVGGEYHFVPNGFSNGTGWHGPAIKRSLPEPLQSFRADAIIEFKNKSNKAMLGNVEMYMLDVNGQCVARVGMRDMFAGTANVHAQARIGASSGPSRVALLDTEGNRTGGWNDFDGMIRIERDGKKWTAYFARVDSKGKHSAIYSKTWTDTKNAHQNPVTQVVFAFQQHGTAPVPTMRVSSMMIYKINTPPSNAVPYIIAPNDTVEFDHTGKGFYRINGEEAKQFKNFGATAFNLKPGANTLAIEPPGFTGIIRWRDAYK